MATDSNTSPRMLGPYEIRRELGRGGMAVVYEGLQPSLNRAVAIKVLPEPFATRPELLARFEREGSIVAQLNHPNIVQVIDRGRQGDTLYIVMEYVDGGGLDTRLAAGTLPLREALDWSAQICDGLDYAHSVGVVHRDLKPSNILIEMRSRRPKITDFGIAQLATTTAGFATLTLENTSIGTLNYMSPEQRQDAHQVDHRTDIFAFGVMLYQMLTGKLPIGHFKLPSLLRADVPMGLDQIVTKCLAEAPDERYQTAGEIRDALLRLTGHDTVATSHGAALGSKGRAAGPARLVCAMVAGGLALAGLAGLVVLQARQRAAAAGATAVAPSPHAEAVAPSPGAAAAAPGPAADTPPAESTPPPADALATHLETDFARARGLIGSGSYTEAAAVLATMVSQHPADPLAADAQFTLAAVCADMGDHRRAVSEYAALVQAYPTSPRLPEARVNKCRSEWDVATTESKPVPVIGHLFRAVKKAAVARKYPAELQRRLVAELQQVVAAHPGSPQELEALRLLAAICAPLELGDQRLAAASLARVGELDATAGADSLYEAAWLYDHVLDEPGRARQLYEQLLARDPEDRHASTVRARLAAWRDAGR